MRRVRSLRLRWTRRACGDGRVMRISSWWRSARKHAEFVRLMSAGGVLVRDRSNDPGCDGCVRITIGTREQMQEAVGVLNRTLETLRGNEGWTMMAVKSKAVAGKGGSQGCRCARYE